MTFSKEKRVKVEKGGFIQGRVAIGEKQMIREKSIVWGPSIIGRATKIESGICAVPYIRICNQVTVNRGDTKDSVTMDYGAIVVTRRIISSIIGQRTSMTSSDHHFPMCFKLDLGENCQLSL